MTNPTTIMKKTATLLSIGVALSAVGAYAEDQCCQQVSQTCTGDYELELVQLSNNNWVCCLNGDAKDQTMDVSLRTCPDDTAPTPTPTPTTPAKKEVADNCCLTLDTMCPDDKKRGSFELNGKNVCCTDISNFSVDKNTPMCEDDNSANMYTVSTASVAAAIAAAQLF